MTTLPVIQPSFAAGELSPFLHGRVDLAKFHVGARTMLNFFVHPHGGASNRPGTRYVGPVADHAVRHRLIPFQFRTSPAGQNYALVFGHMTLQVVMFNNGAPGFVLDGGGNVYTLVTPYAASDLPLLKFVQSADTMTLTHPAYAPRKLTRTGHASWQLSAITFAPATPAPTGLAAASPGAATNIQVTAINDSTGEESLPCTPVASSSNTDSWTWNAVAGCSTYNIYKNKGSIYGFIAQASSNSFTDSSLAPDIGNTPPQQRNPFGAGTATGATIVAGGSGYASPTGKLYDGGSVLSAVDFGVTGGVITSATLATPGAKASPNAWIAITDGAGAGAVLAPQWSDAGDGWGSYISGVTVLSGGSGYHANAQVHSLYYGSIVDYGGYVFTPTVAAGVITGVAVTVRGFGSWNDTDQAQLTFQVTDSGGSGAVVTPVIAGSGTVNPSCSTYYQQRQVFAGTAGQPQTAWFSVAGAFNNMALSQPTKDSDAITRTLTGRQVNEIRHLVPGSSLLIMTSGAEWRCWPGPSAPALTPAACATLPQTAFGCSHVPPIQTDNSLLFVQERGNRVRELRFDVLQDQYQASDMSVLSAHLFFDTTAQYTVQEWAFAEEPFRIVWAVRSDGALLGFTYMREHDVYAWHRHMTDGAVESVCSVPEMEGTLSDAVYLIVNREIGGETRRYVERLAPRTFDTIADAWFLDCALVYSGPPATSVSGLSHLSGKTVAILGDGSVVPSRVVDNTGTVQLDGSYSKVLVGLPYVADLETLDLELPANGGTIQGEMKKIAAVTVRVKEARGVQLGLNQGALSEVKQRSCEPLGSALKAFSGDWKVSVPSEWNRDGRIFVRQPWPLPCTILDLIPEVAVGD